MKQVIEFIEPGCPYCSYVYNYILRDIQIRRDVLNQKLRKKGEKMLIPFFDIQQVDVIANRGCTDDQWFQWYSRKTGFGREGTPIVVVNKEIFYLTKTKTKKLEEEKLSRKDLLKSQIIGELTNVFFEKETVLYDLERMIPETIYIDQ